MTVFLALHTACAGAPLTAGACAVDITPPFDSLIINGGFTERTRGRMAPGDLHARCLVLDDGTARIAMVVVDSCMLPRDVCERAKALAFEATGIDPGRIMISATHTHSAPSAMDYCLGTRADPRYPDFLTPKIAEGIARADRARQPARIGWAQVAAPGFTHCRRWITRPDKMQNDPFGDRTVRAMMHPGYQNPAYIGPAGPVDDELSVLSVQAADGTPIAVLANYSMHYFGGCGPADYFGLFARDLARRLARKDVEPVCMMTQGTSGDLHWMDYSQANRGADAKRYTEGLAALAEKALSGIVYRNAVPLAMDQRTSTLSRRLPDEARLSWARERLQNMNGRRPANLPEVYAEQALFIHENPTERLVLQAIRIGELGITAIPNEVYGITGLKLKAQSPFESTFNIELANGAAGYIPPPAQHRLGGYTTWPARTAGLEEQAEPKIVESLLASLERLAAKPRRPATPPDGAYARAILTDDPEAYWRMEELEGNVAADRSGHGRQGSFEGLIAHGLPGACDRVLQLVGGTMTAVLPPPANGYTCSLWFWSGMPAGTLFSRGPDTLVLDQHGHLSFASGATTLSRASGPGLKTWHHVTVSRGRDEVRIFLDGATDPELSGPVQAPNETDFRLGPFEGRIDEVAVFGRVLTGGDAARHYAASGRTPPPRPAPPRPKINKSSDSKALERYSATVSSSKPLAWWRLHGSADEQGGGKHHGRFENGAGALPPGSTQDNFNGGRLRAEIPDLGNTYSVECWFRNSLPNVARPVTAYLVSRGVDGMRDAEGDHLGIGGTHAASGRLFVYNGNLSKGMLTGTAPVAPDSWHHVVMVRENRKITVYLNGNPDLTGDLPISYPARHPEFFFGARNDRFAPLQGRMDEVALYARALTPEEVTAHYKAASLTPVGPANAKEVPPPPRSPEEGLKTAHVAAGFQLELVAAEPLVVDPVAIDWGADGKLWVAEMADYPLGIDGKAGGRVRFLEDSDGDGRYDTSTVFLEGLNFPAGVMSWRNGVLVTAAPDILYAEDTDGDGRADLKKVLYSGFKEGNHQLRVNGLRWGLDNQVHGANGSHHPGYAVGTTIRAALTGETTRLDSLDFRIQPDTGFFEPLSGPSQFGRERDDWGNWFGVMNSYPIWHYVLENRYLKRNPEATPIDARKLLTQRNPKVYPAKPPQKRYHSFDQSGRFTAASSPVIYRDNLLYPFSEVTHAFACESTHNLVQHLLLERDGVSFRAKRAEPDDALDFFASDDRWCRPVMARTGPDGALWIVDMYRYMIEHPEWLPPSGKAELRPHYRSGDERGRLYRILPAGKAPRPVVRLDRLAPEALVERLASPNGIVRDLAHRLLIHRGDAAAVAPLRAMAADHPSPRARLHAMCALDGLEALPRELLRKAATDPHPALRAWAIRLAETRWEARPDLVKIVTVLQDDPDAAVRKQVALTLGEITTPEAATALARLGVNNQNDPYLRAAVMSSAPPHFEALAEAVLADGSGGPLLDELLRQGAAHREILARILDTLLTPGDAGLEAKQLRSLGQWLDLLDRDRTTPKKIAGGRNDALAGQIARLDGVLRQARSLCADPAQPAELRAASAHLLGRNPGALAEDTTRLGKLLEPGTPPALKRTAIHALARTGADGVPGLLLKPWPGYLPDERHAVVDVLLQRPPWTRRALQAMQEGVISSVDLDASRRQLFLDHEDQALRALAEAVLQAATPPERLKQINTYRAAVTQSGDAASGRAVFDRLCAVCHNPPEPLPNNGPDLRSITDRTRDGLFSSIVEPSRALDPSYVGYTVTLDDGAALFGRILGETADSVTLRQLDGTDQHLPRRRIKSLQGNKRSLMPDGLEAGMTVQEMADLLTFLQGFKEE